MLQKRLVHVARVLRERVQRRARANARVERLEQIGVVYEAAARRVDNANAARLAFGERVPIDEADRLIDERHVQRDVVSSRPKFVDAAAANVVLFGLLKCWQTIAKRSSRPIVAYCRCDERIVADAFHAESLHSGCNLQRTKLAIFIARKKLPFI